MPYRPKTGPLIRISNAFGAKRMGAKTIEVKANHLSLISQPDVITDLILQAAG
jgi:hypothetical protein